MRCLLIALLGLAMPALAAEPVLRPSARLLFKAPEMLQAGHCVAYEEGGAGWGSADPEFYLRGVVVASSCGRSPSLSPISRLSHAACPRNRAAPFAPASQRATSSAQAA